MVPQVSGESESELDEDLDLAAAGDSVVGKCRVEVDRTTGKFKLGSLHAGVPLSGPRGW